MILDDIVAHTRKEVAAAQSCRPLEEVRERAEDAPAPRGFRDALRQEGISLIAEVKRASPSKGMMLLDVEAVELGALYEGAGARAISVLTDEKYFRGSLADLTSVRQHVGIPCLRKEFIIDPYQIYEARAAGADAILLIVRILTDDQLRSFRQLATGLGMAALVEAHNEAEITRALDTGAHIVGINNRDLDTFEVDYNTTLKLKKKVPGGTVLVSESGIHTRQQVRELEDGGVDAILAGEALVTSNDIRAKIRELLGLNES